MSIELKPCPFCQKEKAILLTTKNSIFEPFVDEGIAYHVMCTECGASTRKCYTREQAIELWNKRPSPWHTGEPTDEGDYRVAFAYDGDVFFEILHWSYNWSWYDERHQIIAWQKIEPYKENWKKNDN